MNILVAPDKFKECLAAEQVAAAMARGLRREMTSARVSRVPLADGGEGTAALLTRAAGGRFRRARVSGPLGARVSARWGLSRDRRTAFLETAAASGLALVPPRRRNPAESSTYGTGELVRAALDAGCREIVLGLGGSATVDGGLGLLQALGAAIFLRGTGWPLARPAAGRDLADLEKVDVSGLDPRLRRTRFRAACDVRSPLYGPRGAAFVYGPQKGAGPREVEKLDRGLRRLARVIRRDLGEDVARLPGAGAAGGLGAGLAAFLGARVEPGIDLVLAALGMERLVKQADLILTGEGRVDASSAAGKTAAGLGRLARRWKKPVILIAGSRGPGADRVRACGISAVYTVSDSAADWRRSRHRAPELIAAAAARALRDFRRKGGFE